LRASISERRQFGSQAEQLRGLSEWLIEQQVEEVVRESTRNIGDQYVERCKATEGQSAVGENLPEQCRDTPSCACSAIADSEGAQGGFPDAERLVKRLVAPSAEVELCA